MIACIWPRCLGTDWVEEWLIIMGDILKVEHLSVSFYTEQGEIEAVRDVSLSLAEGEILAIVGESGCGKSVLCKSAAGLLPKKAKIKQGRIIANGKELTRLSEREMRALRGDFFSMIFQHPMSSLHPTISIGAQIMEAVLSHKRVKKGAAKERAEELMYMVGIEDAGRRFHLHPHCFSGGMRQRCALAIALAGDPKILFADEPTTALDVTVQSQILDLLRRLRREKGMSIALVTHDLGVVARAADRVAVMYAGKIVELGTAEDIFYDPRHPYTWALLGALPALAEKGGRLNSAPGMPPSLLRPPPGDAFAARSPYAMRIDYEQMPPMTKISDTHSAATWLLDSRAPKVRPPLRVQKEAKY